MSPQRIQLRRTKGWRKPENTVVVARPSKWGNPFRAVRRNGRWIVLDNNGIDYEPLADVREAAVAKAVELFEHDAFEWLGGRYDIEGLNVLDLTGKDLACWCKPDQLCHADILLAYANDQDVTVSDPRILDSYKGCQ
jgi:hypothetical protein